MVRQAANAGNHLNSSQQEGVQKIQLKDSVRKEQNTRNVLSKKASLGLVTSEADSHHITRGSKQSRVRTEIDDDLEKQFQSPVTE